MAVSVNSRKVVCPPGETNINDIQLNSPGTVLYTAAGSSVRLWDIRTYATFELCLTFSCIRSVTCMLEVNCMCLFGATVGSRPWESCQEVTSLQSW
jgi:WD40 repeat protein